MTASAQGDGSPILVIDEVTRVYTMGDQQVHALKGVSLNINKGEYVAIMGPLALASLP